MPSDILEKLAEKVGDPQAALARRRRMDATVRYALAHLEDWRQAHPNSWIAVYGEDLVAADTSLQRLIDEVVKQNIPLGEVYLDFLSEEKSHLIL